MKLYHIAAMNQNRVIGKDGEIPWHIKEDLQRFKELTYGHPVIMGRKTFESIYPNVPLKGRMNVVLTSRDALYFDGNPLPETTDNEGTGLVTATSIEDALTYCENYHEVYIIGGGGVYEDTLHLVDGIRLTVVNERVEGGDTFYPIDPYLHEEWYISYYEDCGSYAFIDYYRNCK